jgi:hypothetical protein
MWFRFRLSTLLVAVPLLGLATFGGLKWYEIREEERKKSEIDPLIELITATIDPETWATVSSPTAPAEILCGGAYPESDFGPIPVERPIRLPN